MNYKKNLTKSQDDQGASGELQTLLANYRELQKALKAELPLPDGILDRITRLEFNGINVLSRHTIDSRKYDGELLRFLTSFNLKFGLPKEAIEYHKSRGEFVVKNFDELRYAIFQHEESRKKLCEKIGILEDKIDDLRPHGYGRVK